MYLLINCISHPNSATCTQGSGDAVSEPTPLYAEKDLSGLKAKPLVGSIGKRFAPSAAVVFVVAMIIIESKCFL